TVLEYLGNGGGLDPADEVPDFNLVLNCGPVGTAWMTRVYNRDYKGIVDRSCIANAGDLLALGFDIRSEVFGVGYVIVPVPLQVVEGLSDVDITLGSA